MLPRRDAARLPLVGQDDIAVGRIRAEKAPGDASRGRVPFPGALRSPPEAARAGIEARRLWLRVCILDSTAYSTPASGVFISYFNELHALK